MFEQARAAKRISIEELPKLIFTLPTDYQGDFGFDAWNETLAENLSYIVDNDKIENFYPKLAEPIVDHPVKHKGGYPKQHGGRYANNVFIFLIPGKKAHLNLQLTFKSPFNLVEGDCIYITRRAEGQNSKIELQIDSLFIRKDIPVLNNGKPTGVDHLLWESKCENFQIQQPVDISLLYSLKEKNITQDLVFKIYFKQAQRESFDVIGHLVFQPNYEITIPVRVLSFRRADETTKFIDFGAMKIYAEYFMQTKDLLTNWLLNQTGINLQFQLIPLTISNKILEPYNRLHINKSYEAATLKLLDSELNWRDYKPYK